MENPETEAEYDFDEFIQLNAAYMQDEANARKPDPHAEQLVEEMLKECRLGRVEGPFINPPGWPRNPANACGPELLPMDGDLGVNAAASVAFAIVQPKSDGSIKVRRGDDWRRSLHNRTTSVVDSPTHHGIDDHVNAAKYMHSKAPGQYESWGHGHKGAYRQFAANDPRLMYVLIMTVLGPTLWRHSS